jgi:CBS domain-containing protein
MIPLQLSWSVIPQQRSYMETYTSPEVEPTSPPVVLDADAQLAAVAAQLNAGTQPSVVTVRTFLSWFGIQRRGYYKVREIRAALRKAGLLTVPDFESAYIDSAMTFALPPVSGTGAVAPPPLTVSGSAAVAVSLSVATADGVAVPALLGGATADPTYRIGKLAAANKPPISVKPGASVQEAVTLLLSHDFSQLPVMQSEYSVKGMVSWASIGSRLALGQKGDTVDDFIETPIEFSADASLFAVIGTIVGKDYVLIRGEKNKITGIVTTSDLSVQFGQLGEPFLLLGEIENHVRRLIDGKFTLDEVKQARDPADADRDVKSVADLAFGEYVRLLSKPERWNKLNLSVDRSVFVKQLDQVREIRNDVMHFDPDGVDNEDLATLRRFGRFLATLQELGAT